MVVLEPVGTLLVRIQTIPAENYYKISLIFTIDFISNEKEIKLLVTSLTSLPALTNIFLFLEIR